MAITSNTYTGNGSNKLFSITFPYLETTDVDVYLNGVLQTAYSFANATTVEFVTAPGNGVTVVLQRTTQKESLNSTFFPGSSIKAADLNENFDQLLYISQENTDVVNNLPVTVTMLRWKKTATAGQTVLTGNDDNAISLAYTAGFEQVYLNGAHLTRNADYTASDGATITMSVALLVGDLVEVMAYAPTSIVGTNSTGINFTQSGIGAVTRNVDSKLKDVVSVKDFGAVGDGTTNDTTAFTNAFAYLNAGAAPRSLYIPAGNYIVTSETCLITTSYRTVFGDGFTSRLLIPTTATPVGIKVLGTSDTVHVTDVLIADLAVIADGWTAYAGNGISINRADRCSVQRVLVSGHTTGQSWEQGIIFRDTNNGLIANNVVQRIAGNGISLDLLLGSENTRGNLVVGNTIDFVGDSGVGFHNNVRYSSAIGNVITRPAQGGGTGIDIAGCQYCLFDSNNISNSGQFGIRLLQNLSYATVDNIVSNNTVEHPSTSTDPAIILSDCNRNTITGNTLLCNTSAKSNFGLYTLYTTTSTQTHPVTGESILKLSGSIIKDNIISRFANGLNLDAPGGITTANFIVDGNIFQDCTTGINFTTTSNEKRFTLTGHNSYKNCTTTVASTTGGVAQNSDPLKDTLAVIPVVTTTTQTETTVSSALLTSIPSGNKELTGYHIVSESGNFDGIIRYKLSNGSVLASDTFGTVTDAIRSVVIPLPSADRITVTIEKTGTPATGSVSCGGLGFEMITYY
jgi:hypothetical protein